MNTIALNLDYNYESKENLASYLAGIDTDLDDSADLSLKPTYGKNLIEDPNEKPEKIVQKS